jgi:SAM-dependent methyltransferase
MTTREDQYRAQQREMWGAAAAAWERSDEFFEAQVGELSRWMCDAAQIAPGHRVLDLACGTGEPSTVAAARVRPNGHVVATDLSPEMVAAATRKHARLGNDHVEVRVMDAEHIEFPDASFDAVTCRFGLMFCPTPSRAAAEIHRVLKPGGRFAVAVWDEPVRNPFFTLIGGLLAKMLALPPPDPDAPGVFRLAPPGALGAVLAAGGFMNVEIESRPMAFTYDSPEHYWELQTELAAPLRAAVASQPAAKIAELRAAVIALANEHIVDGVVRFAATPLCATGKR